MNDLTKQILLWVALAVILLAIFSQFGMRTGQPATIDYSQFLSEVKSNNVDSVTLKGENAAKKVILRKDIEEIMVSPKSVMPEGLAGTMSVQDFRDLVRYAMAHPFLAEVEVAGPVDRGLDEGSSWKRRSIGTPGRIALPALKEREVFGVRAEVIAPAALVLRTADGGGGSAARRSGARCVARAAGRFSRSTGAITADFVRTERRIVPADPVSGLAS